MNEQSFIHPTQCLSVDEITLILSHRRLGVASEDEVIQCIGVWFGGIVQVFSSDH